MTIPKISLITCGGGRPAAWKLCERYFQRQTLWGKADIEWIVVDDNPKDPIKCTLGQKHIFGGLNWSPGVNTLRYNLDAGLKAATGDLIFLPENDDFFRPTFLEVYCDMLKHADLVGGADVTYYSLRTRSFREMKNFQHASTTQTAFRRSYIPYFMHALHSGEQYFDILCFNQARAARRKYLLFSGQDLCVGIKGVPGRGGIGAGHTNTDFIPDNSGYVKLKELLGPVDAEPYIQMMGEMKK